MAPLSPPQRSPTGTVGLPPDEDEVVVVAAVVVVVVVVVGVVVVAVVVVVVAVPSLHVAGHSSATMGSGRHSPWAKAVAQSMLYSAVRIAF